MLRTAAACASLLLAAALPTGAAGTSSKGRGTRQPVRSLQEIRQAQVVRQAWDLSCGAAALSTVLTYDLGDPVSEADIIRTILRRSDPVRIRARQGFSLLDLKRFAVSRGHSADGYGELDLEQLEALAPAIVPTVISGVDHFMVFRGVSGGQVLLADPAFGNRAMRAERFEAVWQRRIAFVVRRQGAAARATPPAPDPRAFPRVPAAAVRQAVGTRR